MSEILFIPGPVEVDAELREIMAMPLIGHRNPKFVAEVQAVCDKLRGMFLTKQTCLFENAPATALMEAGIRNLTKPGGRVLHLTCGAFSERWQKVSASCGRLTNAVAVDWGHGIDSTTLANALENELFEAVCITHSETSTGVRNPLPELTRAIRERCPDTMILVDAVTSLAGAELRFDEWSIDLAFAGTQKALALPPGLCVYAVSDRALAKADTVDDRGFLLDFLRARDGLAKGRTPATPCVPLVFALSRQLDRIANETIEGRWSRHLELQRFTAEWANTHGFDFFVEDETLRSPTVTTLTASGRDVMALADTAKAAGFAMDKGYGKLKGETFRVGHMGDHTVERLQSFLAAIT